MFGTYCAEKLYRHGTGIGPRVLVLDAGSFVLPGLVQNLPTRSAHGKIVSRWFAPPPRSWTWIQAIAYWAQVATMLGVPDPGWLHGQLAPHAGELAVVGIDCGGAVDSLLAGLAWRLGRLDEAADRVEAGLALETRVGSRIWIKRTKTLTDQINATPGARPPHADDTPTRRSTRH